MNDDQGLKKGEERFVVTCCLKGELCFQHLLLSVSPFFFFDAQGKCYDVAVVWCVHATVLAAAELILGKRRTFLLLALEDFFFLSGIRLGYYYDSRIRITSTQIHKTKGLLLFFIQIYRVIRVFQPVYKRRALILKSKIIDQLKSAFSKTTGFYKSRRNYTYYKQFYNKNDHFQTFNLTFQVRQLTLQFSVKNNIIFQKPYSLNHCHRNKTLISSPYS